MDNWIKCSDELPKINSNTTYGDSIYILIAIPEGNRLRTIPARWVKTKVRGKFVERFEWNHRICPWNPIYWMYLPEPPLI